MTTKAKRAFRATTPIPPTSVQAHLDQLIDKAFAGPLAIGRIAQLMRGSPQDYARLGNLPPVIEGKMLEQAITLLAATNPMSWCLQDIRWLSRRPRSSVSVLRSAEACTRHHRSAPARDRKDTSQTWC